MQNGKVYKNMDPLIYYMGSTAIFYIKFQVDEGYIHAKVKFNGSREHKCFYVTEGHSKTDLILFDDISNFNRSQDTVSNLSLLQHSYFSTYRQQIEEKLTQFKESGHDPSDADIFLQLIENDCPEVEFYQHKENEQFVEYVNKIIAQRE